MGGRNRREENPESGAFVVFHFQNEVSALVAQETAGDGKSESAAGGFRGKRVVDPVELTENLVSSPGGNAGTVILDQDGVGKQDDVDEFPFAGVFAGVLGEFIKIHFRLVVVIVYGKAGSLLFENLRLRSRFPARLCGRPPRRRRRL